MEKEALNKVETIAVSLIPRMKTWDKKTLPASNLEYVRFRAYLVKFLGDKGITKEKAEKLIERLIGHEILIRYDNLEGVDMVTLTTYGSQLAKVAEEWQLDHPGKLPPSFERFLRDSNIIGSAAKEHYYGITD